MEDISFDNHMERFRKNIHQRPKGTIRRHVIDVGFQELLPELFDGRRSMKIADVGGGLGGDACRFAHLGHRVDYYDLSEKMAKEAEKLAGENKVLDRVTIFNGPFQEMMTGSYDLVYAQALLEWLAEPMKGLDALGKAVKSGGFLALAFYNRHSIVFRNLLRGNFYKVESDSYSGDGRGLTPLHPLLPEEVFGLLIRSGFEVRGKRGVRCFSDLCFPHVDIVDRLDDVVRLETIFSREEPYSSLARYIFMVARKK